MQRCVTPHIRRWSSHCRSITACSRLLCAAVSLSLFTHIHNLNSLLHTYTSCNSSSLAHFVILPVQTKQSKLCVFSLSLSHIAGTQAVRRQHPSEHSTSTDGGRGCCAWRACVARSPLSPSLTFSSLSSVVCFPSLPLPPSSCLPFVACRVLVDEMS